MLITKVLHVMRCYCYHKGTYFQANHNQKALLHLQYLVVIATTKVRIFKQITTGRQRRFSVSGLLLLPQRYVFSSKSQRAGVSPTPFLLLLLPQRYVFSSKSQLLR